jgi:phosphoglycolate phosphatase
MQHTLLLFDIDGTLIEGSGEGIEAYAAAVWEVLGVRLRVPGHDMAGKTDRLILKELLEASGIEPGEEQLPRILEGYLRNVMAQIRAEPGRLLPGVEGLLRRLSAEEGLHLAIGTGNLERAARLKLELHGLERFFGTGGFSDDALYREQVVAAGIRKARRAYGTAFDRVAVVGDTARDAAAAQANGAHAILVATGTSSAEELRRSSAAVVLKDLTHPEAFLRELRRLPPTPEAGSGAQGKVTTPFR